MIKQWTGSQCIVLYINFNRFLLYLMIACTFFNVSYGLSALLLLKVLHIHAIVRGIRFLLKLFYWICAFTILLLVLLPFLFLVARPELNLEKHGPMVTDIGFGFLIGASLGLIGIELLDFLFQTIYLAELENRIIVQEPFVTLSSMPKDLEHQHYHF